MKLDELIKKSFKLNNKVNIKNSHGPGDLEGWDSLGHVILMNSLQKTYSITIDMDEMIEIENISNIKSLLKKKGVSNF